MNSALEAVETNLLKGIVPKSCRDVEIGGIYLAIHASENEDHSTSFTVYRVRVEMKEEKQNKAYCFYIDDGFQEWLAYDATNPADQKLYQIDQSLLKYPAQAIHCTLFNLGEFAENEYAKDEALKIMSDKTFVAKIRSTQDEYEAQLRAVDGDPKVNVVLIDTETADDIIVNKVILENVCVKMQPPQFDQDRTLAYVKHISDDGNIYCCLHGSKDLRIIKRMIQRVTANGIHEEYRLSTNDLNDSTKLRLIYDDIDKRWYRALILTTKQQIAFCECIDYGYVKKILHANIYNLDRLSLALSKYPQQAIVARLHGFNSIDYTPKMIEFMRNLLCAHKPKVLVKIATQSEIPLVFVWKRINNVICGINDSIRMEFEK